MDIREQVAKKLFQIQAGISDDDIDVYYEALADKKKRKKQADLIIPLVRADTLKSISKEATRLDKTIYLVPDYTKFREAIKESGIRE